MFSSLIYTKKKGTAITIGNEIWIEIYSMIVWGGGWVGC